MMKQNTSVIMGIMSISPPPASAVGFSSGSSPAQRMVSSFIFFVSFVGIHVSSAASTGMSSSASECPHAEKLLQSHAQIFQLGVAPRSMPKDV